MTALRVISGDREQAFSAFLLKNPEQILFNTSKFFRQASHSSTRALNKRKK